MSFAEQYRAGQRITGGACPIEAGVIGNLADNECKHGRLPSDRTPACGCWPGETRPRRVPQLTPTASPIPLSTPTKERA